ncbi:MAG TPA: DUF502 domain-containing protein [Candidatus Polarisedimenticolia bacterium]|nr:DUF502 domain-containing protein [Candidatus Polarisedimenticolia bacterium]
MRSVLEFLKTTLVGGLFFLLPLIVTLYVLGKGIQAARRLVAPLSRLMPFESVVGVAADTLLAVVALLVVCFLAGLVARTGVGQAIADRAENMILKKIPGYTILRSMTSDGVLSSGVRMQTALAWIEESWVLAFMVERNPSGLVTVFVPSAPTPAAGTIYYLTEDRVRVIDVPVRVAVKLIMQLGVGSAEALRGKFDPGPGPK